MIKIKKVTHEHPFEILQARTDEAAVTGRPLIEHPFWYENIDTGQCYYDLFGCVAWPTEDTDTRKGMPGYAAVIAVGKSERPIQKAWFRLMDEGESKHVSLLFDHILRMRETWGFGLHPGLLQAFYGDPEKHVTRLALLNEELIQKHGEKGAILVTPPADFYCPDTFDNYKRSFETVLVSTPARFGFGGNELLKVKHRKYYRDDPAIYAVGGLIHTLLGNCEWADTNKETCFVVEEG
jgi:hypothetical protein